jgi:hypothetical protein
MAFAMSDRKVLARAIAARFAARFIEIKRERRSKVPFIEDTLRAIRRGRTAEEYRLYLIRTYLGRETGGGISRPTPSSIKGLLAASLSKR